MSRPRINCDFNDRVDETTFRLRARGTVADIERQHVHLAPGLELTLVDYDAFEDGSPAWIVADGVVVDEPGVGFVVRIQPDSFRWEPRHEHDAWIYWSDKQVQIGLPTFSQTTDPSWFSGEQHDEAWSLVCEFRSPPREQGSPSSATVRFLVDAAPHRALKPGVRLRLFERETQAYASVEILN
jgi:hypothetical protein